MTTLGFTKHSVSRSAQRSIRERDIRMAVQYGYRHYEGTDIVCFLGNLWIPDWVDEKKSAHALMARSLSCVTKLPSHVSKMWTTMLS